MIRIDALAQRPDLALTGNGKTASVTANSMTLFFRTLFMLGALLCAMDAGAKTIQVDPNHPAAQDSGSGSAAAPYLTIDYAMRQLMPGDTLNIAPGTYRENLLFRYREWDTGLQTLIQADGGKVTIKGSDLVTGWLPVSPGLYVKEQWAVNSQQVFVDGVPLQQIGGTIFGGYPEDPNHSLNGLHASQGGIWPGRTPGGVEDMTDNSFHYEADTQRLYIKVPYASLSSHEVEVSVRPRLVFGENLRNVTLRQLSFTHSNTTALSRNAAVTLLGNELTLDQIEVHYADGAGFEIVGDNNLIQNSRANYCGQVGMKVRGRGNRLLGNETSYNNTRGFNKWWEAGGAKFVGDGGLRDSEVSDHRAMYNNGDGIWFDWMNSNNIIRRNVSAYNSGFGIHYEASQRGYIYDNYIFANGQRGIYLNHSSESVIAFNLVAANGLEGIVTIDGGLGATRPELVPVNNRVIGNIIGWNGKAEIVLPAGLQGNVSDHNLLFTAPGQQPDFSVGWSPLRFGLSAWYAASSQDLHSTSLQLAIPSALQNALNEQSPSPDWAPLQAIAAQYTVDMSMLGAGGAVIGTHILQPGPTPVVRGDIVMDTADNLGITFVGNWIGSTYSPGYYGADYLHDGNTDKGNKLVRFSPNLPSAGRYEVFARWTADSNRATNVPIDVHAASGTHRITVNQRLNGGQWVSLGTYEFEAGSAGSISIGTAETNGFVIADAVRLTKQGVTVDNTGSQGVTLSGIWTESTYSPGHYGSNYLHDGNSDKGNKTARFTPELVSSGRYEVFARWTSDPNRATNVPLDITSAAGTHRVTVNQRLNGGEWVSLGTYDFEPGNASVLISTGGTNGFVVVDAIHFEKE